MKSIHYSDNPDLKIVDPYSLIKNVEFRDEHVKPFAFYYAKGDSWKKYVEHSDGRLKLRRFKYEIEVDHSNFLIFDTFQKIKEFTVKYVSKFHIKLYKDRIERMNDPDKKHYKFNIKIDLVDPSKEYDPHVFFIDWPKVKKLYSGIEMPSFDKFYRACESTEDGVMVVPEWYNTWDCEGGCVWDINAIKSLKRL